MIVVKGKDGLENDITRALSLMLTQYVIEHPSLFMDPSAPLPLSPLQALLSPPLSPSSER